MKKFSAASLFATITLLLSTTVMAATDYNSSRSNKQGVNNLGDGVDSLLRESTKAASLVARSMVAADNVDGYTGEYVVTVDVRVSIERDDAEKEVRAVNSGQ